MLSRAPHTEPGFKIFQIRELVATTLTALLKGDDGALCAHVREFSTKAVEDARAARKPSNAAASGARAESIRKRHAAVLGLSACVLSCPYDVPEWLPNVLMTLAKMAHDPPPVRTTVTRTFGEFKRTQADTWELQRLKFREEELAVLTELTTSASYFV